MCVEHFIKKNAGTCVDMKKRADVNELLSHKFIVSHVDEIYDTKNYKRWIKETKLENTKKVVGTKMLEQAERKKKDALSDMVKVAKALSRYHFENGTTIIGDDMFQNRVLNLALVLCGEFEGSENHVAKKGMKKFGKVLRRSGVLVHHNVSSI